MEYPLGSGRGGVLRGATVDFTSVFQKARPGEYEADLRIYYGARRPVRVRIPFTVEEKGVKGRVARPVDFDVPDVVEKKVVPGGKRILTIPVMNYENETIQVRARPVDFHFNEYGELVLGEGGPLSVLPFTTLGPLDKETSKCEFEVRPGRYRRVRLEIDFTKLGRDISGGRYVGVEFEARKEGGVTTSILSSSVLLTLPGDLKKEGQIVSLDVQPEQGSQFLDFMVGFKNTGNIHFSPTGKIILQKVNQEGQGETVGEASFEELFLPVLPGDVRLLRAVYREKLSPDEKYMLSIVIEGTDKPLTLTRELAISS